MKIIFIFVFVMIIFNISCKREEQVFFEDEPEEVSSDLIIEIKGAVKIPGIYIVNSNSLVKDVILIAGGLLNTADTTNINMVSPIYNNQMIYIPFTSNGGSIVNKININTAGVSELQTLYGVGESKALNIIEYRNNNGLFRSIEEIMNVSGIGEDIFNKIKEIITI